jgi:uncharacterized integral membrane protein (TIGR00698 family)
MNPDHPHRERQTVDKATDAKQLARQIGPGLAVAGLIGSLAYGLTRVLNQPVADPLVVAMISGIMIRTIAGDSAALRRGFSAAPLICIPAGIAFYALKNLNFVTFAEVRPGSLVLTASTLFVYFVTILLVGRALGQKEQVSYLTAAGSAVCGASAIAITAPAVKADSQDISVSILAVTIAAVVALFILLPFVATTCDLTDQSYGILSGAVLQLTGFVKAAAQNVPFLRRELSDQNLVSLALSVKAARYLGLLIAIPLFASFAQKRFYIPWVLWVFLAAGLLGTLICVTHQHFYVQTLIPIVRPIYTVSWAIALAAIGLNVDIRILFSSQGTKALITAFAGCTAAIITFFVGSLIAGSLG